MTKPLTITQHDHATNYVTLEKGAEVIGKYLGAISTKEQTELVNLLEPWSMPYQMY